MRPKGSYTKALRIRLHESTLDLLWRALHCSATPNQKLGMILAILMMHFAHQMPDARKGDRIAFMIAQSAWRVLGLGELDEKPRFRRTAPAPACRRYRNGKIVAPSRNQARRKETRQ